MPAWYYLVVLIEFPLLLTVAWAGGWWLYALIAFIALMGMGELYSAAIARGMRPEAAIGYLCALLLLAAVQFSPRDLWAEAALVALFVTVAAPLVAQFARTGESGRLRDCAVTTFGVLYIALPMAFVLLLCRSEVGAALTGEPDGSVRGHIGALLIVAAAVWLSDTAAWGIGHMLGRTKLTPKLSPHKTVEGAVAGLVTAVIGTVLVGLWAGLPASHGVVLGLVLGLAAQVGDLAESVIKRDLGVRDFGTLLGPHGGMLDTFDGMLFAAPAAWLYLWLFIMP